MFILMIINNVIFKCKKFVSIFFDNKMSNVERLKIVIYHITLKIKYI